MRLLSNRADNWYFQLCAATLELVQSADISCHILSDAEIDCADFKAKRQHGKFPMLELQNGTIIYESNAIAQYIASRS